MTDLDSLRSSGGRVVERYGWICHVYCLMTDHCHLLIETPNDNLSYFSPLVFPFA
jgi:REP element-mobilizing transposase RayT